ncbi:MAG: hypothetical protein HGA80_05770 [Candidatus Omnitrophica bacterium]|nr:hypothetical protein [Candidatus Omnitrophota bacterium]
MKPKTFIVIVLICIALPCVRSQAAEKEENKGAPAPVVQSPQPDKQVTLPKPAAAPKAEDKLPWWPTDAQPAPVKDKQKGGFWWWPKSPGTVKELWGNRGYAYVNKIIYDWRAGTVRDVQVKFFDGETAETEKKPSLLIKQMIRELKLQFKDNDVTIQPEHEPVLKQTADWLKRNLQANILMAAHEDANSLGAARVQAVEKFLTDQGVRKERINSMTLDKFQEAGLSSRRKPEPGTIDILVAEVEEVLIPGPRH